MANTNFVCFACRIVRRYPGWTTGHHCQFCAQPLRYSYYKFRIPGKRDAKGWKAHQERVNAFNEDVRTRNIAPYLQRNAVLFEKVASTDKRNKKYLADLHERIRENEKHIRRWTDWH